LYAREWFRENGSPDLQLLPLGYSEHPTKSLAEFLLKYYARSLESRGYDVQAHPSFYDYACGAMASEFNGLQQLKQDEGLRKRFPPRPLAGLGPGLIWEPPKIHARTMATLRKYRQREACWRAASNI
jgi:hypothetical protein